MATFHSETNARPVHKGDRVAVIAPSGPLPKDRFDKGLLILSQQYEVVMAEGLLSKRGFLAGSDQRRLCELRWALADPSIKAVFCGRGGYGSLRYLNELLAVPPLERAYSPLVGFSDITVPLLWLAQGTPVLAIHGPVVTQLPVLPFEDLQALFHLLAEPDRDIALFDLVPLGTGLSGGETVEGTLLGGNLEMLSRLCGTPLGEVLLESGPVILLLEEVGEAPYRIDRSLTQLLLSGLLRNVKGVVIGDLVSCDPSDKEREAGVPLPIEVVWERLSILGVPVYGGAPVGHGNRNRALPLGKPAILSRQKAQDHRAILKICLQP